MISALKRNGPQLDTERLVETFENLRGLDLGLRTPGERRSIGAPGRTQGVGFTTRRHRTLSVD